MAEIAVPGPKATRREWIGLAVLALPCLLYSMDLTVLNLAVPKLTADLQPSAAQLLWIVDIYGFLVAGSLITMGTLGDRVGRRRVLLIGAAAFGAASVLAAFASSAEMLIFARAVLGLAGATLAPSTLSLLRNMFLDERERTFAIGVWIASFSAGGAIGPVVGGVLLEFFWWGSVFLVAVPVMVLLLLVGPVLLPEYRDEHAGRMDITSAGMSLLAVLAVIFGVKRIAEEGFGWLPVLVMAVGLGMGLLFVRRQRRLADPLIDMSLFRTAAFSAALGINLLALFTAFGFFLFTAQYLQLVLDMSPLEAGLWSAPAGIAFVAGSMLAPQLVRWFRPSQVISGGLLVSALGFAVLTQIGGPYALAVLMTGLLLFCLGLAPVGTLTTDLIIGSVPPERAGAASAISETSFELGGALGIAVLGSIAAAAYRGWMADAVPAGVPPEAALAARDTLAAALVVAEELPLALGADLAASARIAFTQAIDVTSILCAAMALAAAVLAAILLRRRVRPPGSGHPGEVAAEALAVEPG
ncbi:MFS transporter [Geminicoccus roseus]|uniref:MFS transporter n=1 Tax=Geminicoccus roseus TaxID=404900 RepID=UPI0004095640|nr:MFS transporter [Geminicoccus roseus]